jgi:hypothetical protein
MKKGSSRLGLEYDDREKKLDCDPHTHQAPIYAGTVAAEGVRNPHEPKNPNQAE